MKIKNMDWTARDVMKTGVVTVRPGIYVRELARILDEKDISGAPVLDHHEEIVGVVTKSDLVHFQRTGEYSPDRHVFFKASDGGNVPKGYHVEIPDRTRVSEIMTPVIFMASEETPIASLARLMRRKHIHRLFITRGKKLVGVVTTMDLLKVFEGCGRPAERPKRRRKH